MQNVLAKLLMVTRKQSKMKARSCTHMIQGADFSKKVLLLRLLLLFLRSSMRDERVHARSDAITNQLEDSIGTLSEKYMATKMHDQIIAM
jgi:hypothetical protein